MKHNFSIQKTTAPKDKPSADSLDFGTVFTDHMFIMDYTEEKGWHDGRIVPYEPIALDPAAAVLHYAQEMFEGLKAYKAKDGRILLFRPDKNAERAASTNDRLCIPQIDQDLMIESIRALVKTEQDWIPEAPGTSLYIRPFIIATEAFLGVRPSKEYKYMVILSPVGPYYKGGLAPTKIFVEDEYVRAAPGGTGEAKIGGNYAASLKSQEKAHSLGYSQVLWLDGASKKYVEEIGTSNAFFVIDNQVITAPLDGTILPGITRDSVITLLKNWGYTVREERITIEDIYRAYDDGRVSEVFATGTAAVISPVGELCWKGRKITLNSGEIGDISQKLYDELTAIQLGDKEGPEGWILAV